MKKIEKEKMYRIAPLFAGWEETLIWSCLQGHMGIAFADSVEHPRAALIRVGCFFFFGGEPMEEMVRRIEYLCKGDSHRDSFCEEKSEESAKSDAEANNRMLALLVPQTLEWQETIERVLPESRKIWRYAIKKEADVFDRDYLKRLADTLPEEIELCLIDGYWYEWCLEHAWAEDFVSVFRDKAHFLESGIGFLAVKQGEALAGASSYSCYDDGIEIEVDTRDDCRRQGLASACAARLILECLDMGKYPSWDAATKISVALAEKLGYHLDKPYVTYEWGG